MRTGRNRGPLESQAHFIEGSAQTDSARMRVRFVSTFQVGPQCSWLAIGFRLTRSLCCTTIRRVAVGLRWRVVDRARITRQPECLVHPAVLLVPSVLWSASHRIPECTTAFVNTASGTWNHTVLRSGVPEHRTPLLRTLSWEVST